ncbi:hypothetical protein AKJ59_00860 [candidate division MSBL1 archaeon SCGC-AAA385M02]|uniref:Uncharacterized protein n=1 Tax=candidate division MSBL1 archaeon SCGC-AAA385M02 TaxID=1698287 RepID=A0A133VPU2_9EURY|nr:hypothetical protein AKJ59_00860 [candidate division MSBL1 archaeon SCGC-AAA385M02]
MGVERVDFYRDEEYRQNPIQPLQQERQDHNICKKCGNNIYKDKGNICINCKDDLFRKYRRKQIAELRPYVKGEYLSPEISISKVDKEDGSPKEGDMIARNPKKHKDKWLVAKEYFEDNFEIIEEKE